MQKMIFLIVALLIFSSSSAKAEIYEWIDDNGVVTFKDTPPPASKKRRKVKVHKENDSAPPAPVSEKEKEKGKVAPAAKTVAQKKERFSGRVEIYVTDWCGYCKKALDYMNSRGIDYVAYNIEKESDAKQRYKELGGRGVPLIIIGANKMSGFSPQLLEQYLSRN